MKSTVCSEQSIKVVAHLSNLNWLSDAPGVPKPYVFIVTASDQAVFLLRTASNAAHPSTVALPALLFHSS